MKNIFTTIAATAVLATLAAGAASAQTTAIGTGTGIAGADAAIEQNSVGAPGVGAGANSCAVGFSLGSVNMLFAAGITVENKNCAVVREIGTVRTFYDDDFVRFYLEQNHSRIRKTAQAYKDAIARRDAAAASAAAAEAASRVEALASDSITLILGGARYSVTGTNLERYRSCQTIVVGGTRVKNTICQ